MSLKTGAVRTLCGGDASNPSNLFAYGDSVGSIPSEVRFQHPLGVCSFFFKKEPHLLVSDTFNGKIKLVSTRTGQVKNLRTTEALREPDGIALVDDASQNLVFLVSDSANHTVYKMRLKDNELEVVERSVS